MESQGLSYNASDAVDGDPTNQFNTAYQNMGDPSTNQTSLNVSNKQNFKNLVAVPIWPPRSRTYRGFSTSICDMFRNRYDCCAFVCCGILSYDRNRYLLTGRRPSSVRSRLFFHLIIPLLIFIIAGYCAVYIKNQAVNEVVSALLVLILLAYVLTDCFMGRLDRMRQREEILEKVGRRNEQRASDAGCAHGFCCGCYAIDGHWDQWDEHENESNVTLQEDMCTKLWKSFAKLFCGALCGCFCQICGVCALAQESREMEKSVEPRGNWIDYVTFEPFTNYFHKIVQLRISQDSNPWSHYKAVSQLSKLLLKALVAVIFSLILLSFLNFNTIFTYQNVLVFAATFLQAFIVLFLVHWRYNKFELSLDAVIKYFACGFLLTTGLAVLFETIIAIVLQLLLVTFVGILGGVGDNNRNNINDSAEGSNTFMVAIGMKYPVLVIVYLFVNSFLLAAFVEELCKYFGYLMVQHPDFMIQDTDFLLDRSAIDMEEEVESDDESENDDPEATSERRVKKDLSLNLVAPARNLNSIGMGITIAMVAVALGFACCENLLYIFVYTGGDVQNELAVLIARSAFPVHPLAAAIQSIYVCRQTLEKDETVKIGRIITPAVILHGSFDFSLMLISFLYELRLAKEEQNDFDLIENDYGSGVISFCLALGICVISAIYFFLESDKQKRRLDSLEQSMQTLIS